MTHCVFFEREYKREPSLKWYTVTRIQKEACCIFYKKHPLTMHLDRSMESPSIKLQVLEWKKLTSQQILNYTSDVLPSLLKTRKALLCRIEAFWKYLGV
jgi:hypothetical protein